MVQPTPEALFAARLAADPGAPLVTFYDDESGERAELSAKSLGNWIAKTHFLLLDELALAPGDRACVRLPVHWLAAPILVGCWFAGLEVVTAPEQADVVFADADSLAGMDLAAVEDVFSVSLLSMARPSPPPPGASDYATSVRPMPDSWASVGTQAGAEVPALDGLSRARLANSATEEGQRLGLQSGGRLLWTTDWAVGGAAGAGWTAALLAPLAVGGSVVLVRHPDPSRIEAKASAEHATVVH
jgi:uncharacterized protein (TIGR03089 family)